MRRVEPGSPPRVPPGPLTTVRVSRELAVRCALSYFTMRANSGQGAHHALQQRVARIQDDERSARVLRFPERRPIFRMCQGGSGTLNVVALLAGRREALKHEHHDAHLQDKHIEVPVRHFDP